MKKDNKKLKIENVLVLGVVPALLFTLCVSMTSCSASNNNVERKINFREATASRVKKDRRGIVKEADGVYLYDENGSLLKNYLYKLGDDYYYANSDGKIVGSTFVAVDARTNSNVKLTNTEAVWYYFEANGKAMRGKTRRIGALNYEFNYAGHIISELPSDLKNKGNLDLSDKKIGDMVIFGSYDEKPNGEYVYLAWDLLDKKDDEALLATCYVVDVKKVNENYKWGDSELRTWLNNHFLNWAFKKVKEYNRICETEVMTDGEVTKDKIFLLSEDEVNKYYQNDLSKYRVTIPSRKVKDRNLYYEDDMSPYCLRDGQNGDIKVIGVDGKTYLSRDYNWYLNEREKEEYDEYEPRDYNVYGIRPAVWVKIK